MTPFSLWLRFLENVVCRLRGHQWVADETVIGEFVKYEGDYCARCWKFNPYTPAVKAETP